MSHRHQLLRAAAFANGHKYHLIVIARVGKTLVWKTNLDRRCAERRLLAHLDGVQVDAVEVLRFRKAGGMGMAKPCAACRLALQAAGVRWVKYSTPDGMVKERV